MDQLLLANSPYHAPVLNISNKDHADKIKELTKNFLHTKQNLLNVSKVFSEEIRSGLASDPPIKSSLIMANTFVTQWPDGSERGDYISLDLGSTNFRVVLSRFGVGGNGDGGSDGDGGDGGQGDKNEFKVKHYTVPTEYRRGQSSHLFNFFADCIADFVATYLPTNRGIANSKPIPLGFTFSFPMIQQSIRSALLETWTKDFDCPDAVGQDAAQLLQQAIDRHPSGALNVRLVAILNDATGTLVQGMHLDPMAAVGLILGTGSNACYVEKIQNVKYWKDRDQWLNSGQREVIIDMECGGFGDNGVIDWAKTPYDLSLDRESLFPNSYTFEKLFGGKFLGDICRRVLVDLATRGLAFGGKVTDELLTTEQFRSSDVTDVESGADDQTYESIGKLLGYDHLSVDDREIIRYVCAIVSVRGAGMLAAILSNLIQRIDDRPVVTIAIDGSVYKYHPKFHTLITDFIGQLLPDDCPKRFKLILAEDGSGKGAGLVAAIAQRLNN
ncbi:hexokinase-2-like [Oppia nitens]|uniref:hexokinase-2-like n=1 Tax=Oppia nitens TaxID=1686743 RepID=UPI0023DA1CBF|nr:hexokinase-2-like [Oppia nitens]